MHIKKQILGLVFLMLGIAIYVSNSYQSKRVDVVVSPKAEQPVVSRSGSATKIDADEEYTDVQVAADVTDAQVTQEILSEHIERLNSDDLTPLLKDEIDLEVSALDERGNRIKGNGFGVFLSFRTQTDVPSQASTLFGLPNLESNQLTVGIDDKRGLQILIGGLPVLTPNIVLEAERDYSFVIAYNDLTQQLHFYSPEEDLIAERDILTTSINFQNLSFKQKDEVESNIIERVHTLNVYERPISHQQIIEETEELHAQHLQRVNQKVDQSQSSSSREKSEQLTLPFTGVCPTNFNLLAFQSTMLKTMQSVVTLPVEVLGREGITKQVSFNLTGAQANQAKYLWLQANNLAYENKGSVRVNGGAWVDLNHDTVTMRQPEKLRGGMSHGGHNTIIFRMQFNNFRAGTNTVVFRFNESDAISIGYRIVKLQVANNQLEHLLPNSQFVSDNPATWVAPFSGTGAIAAGELLWRKRNSLWNHYKASGVEGFWYGYALPVRKRMKASCADCHTQDGRDLEMFSYSNLSIIERSKYHGLSQNQGKQIASYIRSLSARHANVDRVGRPWNPPYQPGPIVAQRAIHNWAAGAGVDAVLAKDSDMVPHLFGTPKGQNPTQAQVNNFFKTDSGYDSSTLPLAIQFPDWKHWLPMIHPMDAFNNERWERGMVQSTPFRDVAHPRKAIEDFRAFLANEMPRPQQAQITFLKQNENRFKVLSNRVQAGFRRWWSVNSPDPSHWRSRGGTASNSLKADVPREWASSSLAKVQAVKQFELFNEFNLQDKTYEIATPQERREFRIPIRHWLTGTSYHVYPTGPHFQAGYGVRGTYRGQQIPGTSTRYLGQELSAGIYESTNWYELQSVLTPGHGTADVNGPVHYNYQMPLIERASKTSGIYESMRYMHNANRMYQLVLNNRQKGRENGWKLSTHPADRNRGLEGFEMRTMAPFYLFYENNKMIEGADRDYPGLGGKMATAHLNQFLDEMERNNEFGRPLYNVSNWPRINANYTFPEGQNKNHMLDHIGKSTYNPRHHFSAWADRLYKALLTGRDSDTSTATLNRLRRWCKRAWPRMPWDAINLGSAPQPAVAATILPQTIGSEVYGIKVNVATNGSNRTIEWRVNNQVVLRNQTSLSSFYFNSGDTVRVIVNIPGSTPFSQNYNVTRSTKDNQTRLPNIGSTVALEGNNTKYMGVQTRFDPIKCDRNTASVWESFLLENAGSGKVYLRDYRGYYISVMPNKVLTASSRQVADAEAFYLIAHAAGISLQSTAGLFVSSEDGASPMTSNRARIAEWETFRWSTRPRVMNTQTTNSVPSNGDIVTFRAGDNGKYLNSMDGREAVGFYANNPGPWERFRIVAVGGNRFVLRASNGKYLVRNAANLLIATATNVNVAESFQMSGNNNTITLKGENEKFLSSENSAAAVRVNRINAAAWETFIWQRVE